MNTSRIDPIVRAVLYEGYILYPYRPSSRKNQRERFTFGRVYPRAYSDSQNGVEPCLMQTECLLRPPGESQTLEVSLRFLQASWREVGLLPAPVTEWPSDPGAEPEVQLVPSLMAAGILYQTWQEAVERSVTLPPEILLGPRHFFHQTFHFDASRTTEPIRDETGQIVAVLHRRHEALDGELEVTVAPGKVPGCRRVTVRVWNDTQLTDDLLEDTGAVLMRTFASTHTVLQAPGGNFVSLTDPDPLYAGEARECRNVGTWPVLVGDAKVAHHDTVLSSPVILYDFPAIAPESPTEFFDSTEIDQMLSLRVLTMTDEEKREMRDVDPLARRLLERASSLGAEDFLHMHGTMRDMHRSEDFFNPAERLHSVVVGGGPVRPGDRVKVKPKGRADALDVLFKEKTAVVEAIEQTLEGAIQVAVVFDDDPGKDLGMTRQPGHRFFYATDELEAVKREDSP
jgi:hypothetical protein